MKLGITHNKIMLDNTVKLLKQAFFLCELCGLCEKLYLMVWIELSFKPFNLKIPC
jgi:hypothetical protein